MDLSAPILAPLVEQQPDLVIDALDDIYRDLPGSLSLDVLRDMAATSEGLFTVADLLLSALNRHQMSGRFVAYLRARGIDLLPRAHDDLIDIEFTDDFGSVVIGPVPHDDLDLAGLAAFAGSAQAFRCRIRIDGQVRGSGALISPRLVLTAAHVVEGAMAARGNGAGPRLEITASDGKTYPARVVWSLPHHAAEAEGDLPPPEAADTHADVALLRVDSPLGRLFGRMKLPDPPPDWIGPGLFTLIHFPDGQVRGLSIGRIQRNGPDDIRQFHTVDTEPGSSGGPGFDRRFAFLGLHQGRWQAFRRIVPYARFATHPDFRVELERDRPPAHPWSLDGSLDSHMIIGRGLFFDTLSVMIEGSAPNLRGVWVKRAQIDQTEGLGFGFRMLEAFLAAHDRKDDILRLSTGADTDDLIGYLEALVFGAQEANETHPGVRVDETTSVAHDADRARALADRLDRRAQIRDRALWLYFENPPSGLSRDAQFQFEHLIRAVILRAHVHLILAGFETYDLMLRAFTRPDEARRSSARGVVVEYLGNFRRSDVAATVQAMNEGLRLDWTEAIQQHFVSRALRDIPQVAHDTFAAMHLGVVGEVLRDEAKRELGTP